MSPTVFAAILFVCAGLCLLNADAATGTTSLAWVALAVAVTFGAVAVLRRPRSTP